MLNIEPYGEITNTEIINFEEKLGFAFPLDYRQFLVSNNGGKVNNQTFFIDELEIDVLMHVFYGINVVKNKVLNIDFWLEKYGDEIPEHSLLIGNDQGGGFILYLVDGEDSGLYYYDHSHLLPQSSEERNTYFLAETFKEFIDSLENVE